MDKVTYVIGNVKVRSSHLERFSIECREIETKEITLTNHNGCKPRDEPIRIRSNFVQPVPSAGKKRARRVVLLLIGRKSSTNLPNQS